MKNKLPNYTKKIDRIAKSFSMLLEKEIGKKNLNEVVRLNEKEEHKSICHSHDFCDANMVMNEAITEELGLAVDINSTYHQSLWNDSWNLAKKYDFFNTTKQL